MFYQPKSVPGCCTLSIFLVTLGRLAQTKCMYRKSGRYSVAKSFVPSLENLIIGEDKEVGLEDKLTTYQPN